jgi:bifunctional DNA-binding transcriptional regulator/antitoxin component of YhaV-PrlF toxin-antitoxin module
MKRAFSERRQKSYAARQAAAAAVPPPGPLHARVRLGPGGRFVIPKKLREAMELEPGESLTARVVDGELRVYGFKVGLRRVRELVARHVPPGVSLVDELLKERRREVEKEEREIAEEKRRWRRSPKLDV